MVLLNHNILTYFNIKIKRFFKGRFKGRGLHFVAVLCLLHTGGLNSYGQGHGMPYPYIVWDTIHLSMSK